MLRQATKTKEHGLNTILLCVGPNIVLCVAESDHKVNSSDIIERQHYS